MTMQDPVVSPAGAAIDTTAPALDELTRYKASSSLWRDAFKRLFKNRLAVVGLVVVLAFAAVAVLAQWISPYTEDRIFPGHIIEGPSSDHWMGTTGAGQDTLSRLIWGAQRSLFVGVFV